MILDDRSLENGATLWLSKSQRLRKMMDLFGFPSPNWRVRMLAREIRMVARMKGME